MNLFFQRYSKNWILLTTTQRIEPFFFFIIWLWALNSFFNTTQKLTRKIWLGILFFLMWLEALNLLFCDSKNWTFLKIWVTELNPSFWYYSKNWTLFKIWLQELNFFSVELFFQYDSKNWTLFFRIWPKELNLFWMTQRIELFLTHGLISWIWRKRFEPLCSDMTQRIDLFFSYDSKNWTLYSWKGPWLKELNLFSIRLEVLIFQTKLWLKEFNLFVFSKKKKHVTMTQRFFKILSELNFFFQMWLKKNELFFERYSKNCTVFVMSLRIDPFF